MANGAWPKRPKLGGCTLLMPHKKKKAKFKSDTISLARTAGAARVAGTTPEVDDAVVSTDRRRTEIKEIRRYFKLQNRILQAYFLNVRKVGTQKFYSCYCPIEYLLFLIEEVELWVPPSPVTESADPQIICFCC